MMMIEDEKETKATTGAGLAHELRFVSISVRVKTWGQCFACVVKSFLFADHCKKTSLALTSTYTFIASIICLEPCCFCQ